MLKTLAGSVFSKTEEPEYSVVSKKEVSNIFQSPGRQPTQVVQSRCECGNRRQSWTFILSLSYPNPLRCPRIGAPILLLLGVQQLSSFTS